MTRTDTPILVPLQAGGRVSYARQVELAPLSLWQADGADAVVLIVPALGTPARVYKRLAQQLISMHLHVGVVELRGVGSSTLRAAPDCDWGYLDLVDGEVAHGLAALRERFPALPVVAVCHSLGGQLALLHQARHAQAPFDGVVLAAASTPYWRRYPWPMSWVTRAFAELVVFCCRRFGYFPGHRLGFGGRQSASLMRQWAAFAKRGDLPAVLGLPHDLRSDRPLLGLHVRGDAYAPRGGMDALLRLGGVSRPVVSADVDGAPGHFGWLKQPARVAAQIAAFARGCRVTGDANGPADEAALGAPVPQA